MLEELGSLEPHQFKSRAYRVASKVLAQAGEDEFLKTKDWLHYVGIGKSINDKIKEYVKTGTIAKLDELRSKAPNKSNLYKVRKTYTTKRVTYEEATELLAGLLEWLPIDPSLITVCGSYRRRKSLIGDLDLVVNSDDTKMLSKVTSKVKSLGYQILSAGDHKLSFILDPVNKVPVDVILTNPEEYWYAVLYLTGSMEFNIKMRAQTQVR